MANFNSESHHSLIGFLTPEYPGFLKLQVVPRFTGTGTCISLVPVNRGILTSLLSIIFPLLKSILWLFVQAWLVMFEPLLKNSTFLPDFSLNEHN
jgi:hypothetical protein